MRKGINPQKITNVLEIESYHRIIIPVYIPNLTEDYFKHGLKVFKLCIESILLTIHSKTTISIINNACCEEVISYLEELYAQNDCIDQLFHSKINLGKINALNTAIKSNLEPLITITDADVLFLNGWQKAVENVFVDFPKAGMVSPVPNSIMYDSSFVNATFYHGFMKGIIKFRDVIDSDGLKKFQESIGRKLYKKVHLEKFLTLTQGRKEAVIGCGHFVVTMRAKVFYESPKGPSHFKIIGGSEKTYIDKPNDDAGFLRLATMDNYAYHLGNEIEPWMLEKFDEVKAHLKDSNQPNINLEFDVNGISKIQWFIGKVLYRLLFRTKGFKRIYFRLLGMNNSSY
jgi:glycosyltransferase involved in cell wall biosynthesis